MAQIGSFQGPSGPYGSPVSSVHPTDNDITPTAAQAEADMLKAQAQELFEDLANVLRTEKPKR